MPVSPHQISFDSLLPDAPFTTYSDQSSIIAGLQNARVMVRALVRALHDAERLELTHQFGEKLVRSWWDSSCEPYQKTISLREPSAGFSTLGLSAELEAVVASVGKLAARLEPEIAAYQIGLTYTYLLPSSYRSSEGIYYTPPVLSQRLIHLATATGVDWSRCRVLDPACGGGAFLAPVAKEIIDRLHDCSPHILLANIANRVKGYEKDAFGAWLAQIALDIVLLPVTVAVGKKLPNLVKLCNSMEVDLPHDRFDLVIGNPPYGRTRLDPGLREKYKRSLFGHANVYGIFKDLALRHARENGVIAFVTPTSFLAGEYFKNLRALLGTEAPLRHLDFVAARRHVFDDVLQETALATYRLGGERVPVDVHELHVSDAHQLDLRKLGDIELPLDSSKPWVFPRNEEQAVAAQFLQHCTHHLRDWGYSVKTGPLVWNRFKQQLFSRKAKHRYPLIWAESVLSTGEFVWRAEKRNHEPWFEIRDKDGWLVSRQPCVLLQRTTAKEQHRRLIAAALPASFIEEHGAVVVENHLNMLKPIGDSPPVGTDVLAAFLNSKAADLAFRCVSGSVAVSAYELEALPLPAPDDLVHLQDLVANRAPREAIEAECNRLYQG